MPRATKTIEIGKHTYEIAKLGGLAALRTELAAVRIAAPLAEATALLRADVRSLVRVTRALAIIQEADLLAVAEALAMETHVVTPWIGADQKGSRINSAGLRQRLWPIFDDHFDGDLESQTTWLGEAFEWTFGDFLGALLPRKEAAGAKAEGCCSQGGRRRESTAR